MECWCGYAQYAWNRASIIERGVRTNWCWRDHRAEIFINHHAKNSHQINMNDARLRPFFPVCYCCLVFFGSIFFLLWIFSFVFFRRIQSVFSIAIYDLYVIHISRYLRDIFFVIELIFISCFLVCDLIWRSCHFIQLHVQRLSSHCANGKTEMCCSFVLFIGLIEQ